jgi:hypothetical protein
MVDRGAGTTLSRRRRVGAKTPCGAFMHHLAVMQRVRFADVGGITGLRIGVVVLGAQLAAHQRAHLVARVGAGKEQAIDRLGDGT